GGAIPASGPPGASHRHPSRVAADRRPQRYSVEVSGKGFRGPVKDRSSPIAIGPAHRYSALETGRGGSSILVRLRAGIHAGQGSRAGNTGTNRRRLSNDGSLLRYL